MMQGLIHSALNVFMLTYVYIFIYFLFAAGSMDSQTALAVQSLLESQNVAETTQGRSICISSKIFCVLISKQCCRKGNLKLTRP